MEKVLRWLMIPMFLIMAAVFGGLYILISEDFNWVAHVLAIPIGFVILVLFSLADKAGTDIRKKILGRKK